MRSLTSALFLAALATASSSLAGAASNQPAQPVWSSGWVSPPGRVVQPGQPPVPADEPRILPRDQAQPPAAIGFGIKIDPPEGWDVTVTSDVQAAGLRLTQEEASPKPGAWLLSFRIDPCKAVGLDTPGTQIPVTYEFGFAASHPDKFFNPAPKKGSFILKLDRDNVAPMINTLNAPSTAYRDQTIQVTVAATDVSEEIGEKLVWDSGLRTFTLDANPDALGLQTEPVDETMPQRCDEKVKKERHVFSYTIPHSAQPGDEIKLHAEAVDWTGNTGFQDTTVKIVAPPKPDTPFPPRAGCKQISGSPTFYQGIGGKCTGELQICGEVFRWSCNAKSFWRPMSIMERVPGPDVCCDDWKNARQSKKPCDVGIDADCDGIRNTEDKAPNNQNKR
jgi:hypothetical protein